MGRRRASLSLVVLTTLLLLCSPLRSQVNTGRISGAITDQSGGAIAGATVTVTDVARGESRPLTTDAAGLYAAPNLIPGIYTVRAEFKGFQTVQRQNIDVGVGGDVRVDLMLPPGEQAQTVTVTESLPMVPTTNAQTGGTLDNSTLSELPVNGRNYRWLVEYVPGVIVTPGGGVSVTSVNGAPSGYAMNYMIDGLIDMTVLNREPTIGGVSEAGDTTLLPYDAIQEMNIVINAKAEYGWNPGAQQSIGLKSGTNSIHGTAFAFGRDTDLDAKNAFIPTGTRGPVAFEQFGGTLGGAIKKNKLFYILGFEGENVNITTTSQETLPTTANVTSSKGTTVSIPEAIAGINSYIAANPGTAVSLNQLSLNISGCGSAASLAGITNPASITCSGNQVGAPSLFNNFSNNPTGLVTNTFPDTGGSYNGLVKVDYHLSDHHSLNASYINGQYDEVAIGNTPLAIVQPWWEEQLFVRSQDLRGVEIWSPNSNWLNEARVGWDHSNRPTTQQQCAGPNWQSNPAGFGVAATYNGAPNYASQYGYVSDAPECGPPVITITGFTGQLGFCNCRVEMESSIQGADNLSYTHSTHQFKFGLDYRAESMIGAKVLTGQSGAVAFGGAGDAAFSGATPLESFLAGESSTETIRTGSNLRNVDLDKIAVFAQDDWRIFPRLTLNIGLREELQTPPRDTNGQIGNFDPNAPDGMIQNNQIWRLQSDFSPHLGLAWDVTGKGTTVIRASGGLAYDTPQLMTYIAGGTVPGNDYGQEPTGFTLVNANGSTTGPAVPGGITSDVVSTLPTSVAGVIQKETITWAAGAPLFVPNSVLPTCGDGLSPTSAGVVPIAGLPAGYVNPPTCSGDGGDPNIKFYRFINWTIDYQHALTNNLSLDIAYVGSHSYDLVNTLQINQPTPGLNGSANEQLRRPYTENCSAADGGLGLEPSQCFPWFGSIPYLMNYGSANYAGLQTNLRAHNYHGFDFTAAYTYSRTLGQGAPLNSLAPFADPAQTYGPLAYDFRNHFSLVVNYAVPGRKAWGQMLQGWELNGAVNYLSSVPLTAADTTNDESGTGIADPWTLVGKPGDFNQILAGGVGQIPCFGVSGSSFAGQAGCTTVGAFPQACLNAATNEAPGPTNTGLTSNLTSTVTGSPSEPQNSGLYELYKLGCYMQGSSVMVPPALGTFGTMRTGILRIPGLSLTNASVTKNWKIKERLTTQFRFEIFNLFNRTQYGAQGTNLGSPSTYGIATSTPDVAKGNAVIGEGGPREMQLGLKLIF